MVDQEIVFTYRFEPAMQLPSDVDPDLYDFELERQILRKAQIKFLAWSTMSARFCHYGESFIVTSLPSDFTDPDLLVETAGNLKEQLLDQLLERFPDLAGVRVVPLRSRPNSSE